MLILLAEATGAVVVLAAGLVIRVLGRPPRRTAGSAAATGRPLDPGEMGWSCRSVTYRDAVVGAMELWVVQGRSAGGPVTLLVHGWADSRWWAMDWLEAAGAVSRAVVLMDLPGHGWSPVRRCRWGEVEIDLLGRLVEWARGQYPGRAVMLMGYSLGGVWAMAAAERYAVEAVVADSVFISPLGTVRQWMRLRGLNVFPVTTLVQVLARWRWPAAGRLDLRRVAERLGCPLLLMHGREDRLADVEQARAIAAAAQRGELVVWPQAGHNQAVRLDGDGYRRRLERFVETAVRPYHETAPNIPRPKD